MSVVKYACDVIVTKNVALIVFLFLTNFALKFLGIDVDIYKIKYEDNTQLLIDKLCLKSLKTTSSTNKINEMKLKMFK